MTEDVRAAGIIGIELADADRGPGGPDPGKIARAVAALHEDGAVVVSGAVDPEILLAISARMANDLKELLRRPARAENFRHGHLQQDPPPELEYLSAEILANTFALRVCREALRLPLTLTSYSNNTNLPGSVAQPVHVDEGQRWPCLRHPHPPARLIVNVPLGDTSAANGAIELWLGTHRDTRICQWTASADQGVSQALEYFRAARNAGVERRVNRRVGLTIPDALQAERRRERPPVRAETRVGSLIIRDPRLWHRGTTNMSDKVRFMLAMVYDPPWRRLGPPIELPTSAKELLDRVGLDVHAAYCDGPINHLDRHLPPRNSPFRRPRPTAMGAKE